MRRRQRGCCRLGWMRVQCQTTRNWPNLIPLLTDAALPREVTVHFQVREKGHPWRWAERRHLLKAIAASTGSLVVDPDGASALTSRAYLIFFELTSSAVSERGREVAAEFTRNLMPVLELVSSAVTGYAPDVDGATQSMALGYERAIAVTDLLVSLGVPRGSIETISGDAARWLVPNSPRNPQNRYANLEIRWLNAF